MPAGTDLFKSTDSNSDLDRVQIFNSEGTRLYATVLTVPADRMQPSEKTVVTLAEQATSSPEALLTASLRQREVEENEIPNRQIVCVPSRQRLPRLRVVQVHGLQPEH
jgi:hypothetical protein